MRWGGGGTVGDQGGPNIAGTNGPGGPLIAGDHKFRDRPMDTGQSLVTHLAIPFQSSPVQSIPPFRSSPPNPYTRDSELSLLKQVHFHAIHLSVMVQVGLSFIQFVKAKLNV